MRRTHKGYTRRRFIQAAGAGLGALCLPGSDAGPARAAGAENRVLVALFLRGGADGLNLVIPRSDPHYAGLRDSIAVPEADALPLDGFFDLHPALAPLHPRFTSGQLAVVHAVGGTGDYSHFAAQDAMERATGGNPALATDGWLHRALDVLHGQGGLGPVLSLSGVSLAPRQAEALVGENAGLRTSFPSIGGFALEGRLPDASRAVLADIYTRSADPRLAAAGNAVFEAVTALEGIGQEPAAAPYPGTSRTLNEALKDAARLVKHPELGVRVITVDFPGWDHHASTVSSMRVVAAELAHALDAFVNDLGAAADRTLVLAMTEFGRTARLNGSAGTDHGWGSLMFALGGGVTGGRVLSRANPHAPGSGLVTPDGHWPGLGPDELHVQPGTGEPRDLEATTDFRDVFGEVATRFLGLSEEAVRDRVLRGYAPDAPGLFA